MVSKIDASELQTQSERSAERWQEGEDGRLADARARVELRLRGLESREERRDIASNVSPTKFLPPQRAAYLLGLETHGGYAKAAQEAGITRATVQNYAIRVPSYAQDEREALELYRDSLATEVHRRAVDGVLVQRYDRNGNSVGAERQFSDGLLSKQLERTDRRIGDLPAESAQHGFGNIDAAMVQRLSPEGRNALRMVISELAGLVPTPEERQLEGIPDVIDAQVVDS